jgi:hypothetical protein
MLQVSTSTLSSTPLLLRVRGALMAHGCGPEKVWAKSSGANVLIGLAKREPYARVVPLGNGSYGLSFRAVEARPCRRGTETSHTNAWEPLLLVDELHAVVEHALIAVDAIDADV